MGNGCSPLKGMVQTGGSEEKMPGWPRVRQAHPAADSGLLIRTVSCRSHRSGWSVLLQERPDGAAEHPHTGGLIDLNGILGFADWAFSQFPLPIPSPQSGKTRGKVLQSHAIWVNIVRQDRHIDSQAQPAAAGVQAGCSGKICTGLHLRTRTGLCVKGRGLRMAGITCRGQGCPRRLGVAVGSVGGVNLQQRGGVRRTRRGLGQPPVFGGAVGGGWGGSWEELGGVVSGLGQGHS